MSNIAVLNLAGSVGKTTLTKQLICAMLPEAKRVQIESINSAASGADVEMNARQFRYLAEQLAIGKESLVIDIGGSNIESVLRQMSTMEGIDEDINWWVIPVDERAKVIKDTIETVTHLVNELNVNPGQIVVIANNIEFPDEVPTKLASIAAAAKKAGFHFVKYPIIKSDLFDLVKDEELPIIELAKDETDYNAMIAAETDEKKLAELGRKKTWRRMAKTLSRNLSAVWAATPMGASSAE